MKIPKTIHYVWLSGNKMPDSVTKCMNSWKRHMPEYELILWDENRFNINSIAFTRDAYSAKNYAFVSDYIRLYALYTEGGIYFDTDVYVKKNLDDFLGNDFFTAIEYHEAYTSKGMHKLNADGTLKDEYKGEIFTHGIQILAALMGSVKGHPFLKSCLDWYDSRHFSVKDWVENDNLISPYVYAHVAEEYGFRYKNELQKLQCGMTIYPNTVFAGNLSQTGKDTYAIHCCDGLWRSKRYRAFLKLRESNFLRALLGKKKLENIK